MTTRGTGEPTQGGQGTMGSGQAPQHGSRQRETGGESGGIGQTLRETTYRKLDDQKARASETLGSVAGAVRGMTEPLREHGQSGVAEYISKAADGIDRWASQLRDRDIQDAVRALGDFARRQPALFLGLAFGTGALVARFLKSSSSDGRRYGDWRESSGSEWATGQPSAAGGLSSSGFSDRGVGSYPAGTTSPAGGRSPAGRVSGDTPRASEWPSGREVL